MQVPFHLKNCCWPWECGLGRSVGLYNHYHHAHHHHYHLQQQSKDPKKKKNHSELPSPLQQQQKMLSYHCSKLLNITPLYYLILFKILFNFELCFSLRLVMLEVPSPSFAGESIELSCIYELENDKLYSVKWYKNDVEFYRYVPKDWPPGQFLPINGIRVDLGKSGMNSVFLKFIDINTAGLYRCEVSAEAPSFVTAEGEKELQVTVLPLIGPQIIGVKPSYKLNDEVDLTCISAKSKPYPTLKWYINNQEVKNSNNNGDEAAAIAAVVDNDEDDNEYAMNSANTVTSVSSNVANVFVSNSTHVIHDDGLETTSQRLRFQANQKYFKSGIIRVKCSSILLRTHIMSNEEIIRKQSKMSNNKYLLDNYLSENLSQPKADSSASTTSSRIAIATLIWIAIILNLLTHNHP